MYDQGYQEQESLSAAAVGDKNELVWHAMTVYEDDNHGHGDGGHDCDDDDDDDDGDDDDDHDDADGDDDRHTVLA